MRFFASFGSVLVASGLAFTAGGCFVHDNTTSTGSGNPPPQTEVSLGIDKGGALTTDPGQGVAILVEYEGPSPTPGSSRWNVQTTCDTLKSTYACTFDLYTRSQGIQLAGTLNAKSADYVDRANGQLHGYFETSTDIPGFTFDVPQGQDVEVEAYLDGQSAAQYVFYVSRGVTHAGVPTNPVLFVPAQ